MTLNRSVTITYTMNGTPLGRVDVKLCDRISLSIARQTGHFRRPDTFILGDCDIGEMVAALADVSRDYPGVVIEADVATEGESFLVTAHDGRSQRRDELVYYEPVDDTLAMTGDEWREGLKPVLRMRIV